MSGSVVLDACHVLAFFQGQAGSELLEVFASGCGVISDVGYQEVSWQLVMLGGKRSDVQVDLDALVLEVVPLTEKWAGGVMAAQQKHPGVGFEVAVAVAFAEHLKLKFVGATALAKPLNGVTVPSSVAPTAAPGGVVDGSAVAAVAVGLE